jgi:hypothetical protein
VPVPVHLWILLADGQSVPSHRDHFWIWPLDDHNVTAIEAYGTLAVAVVSVVIAFLIWRGVKATRDDVNATRAEVAANKEAIQTSAIQTIAGEMLTLGRWLVDHPDYGEALRLPADQETETGEAVATVHADFMDAVFSQEDLFPPGDVEIWIRWFQNRMDMWPQLDKFVRTHLDWYPPYMKRVLQRAETPESDEGGPEAMVAKPSPAQVDKPNPVRKS